MAGPIQAYFSLKIRHIFCHDINHEFYLPPPHGQGIYENLTKQLDGNFIDFDHNGQGEEGSDEDSDFDYQFNEIDKYIITFGCDLRGDDDPLERRFGYVKYVQVSIDDTTNKKRKA